MRFEFGHTHAYPGCKVRVPDAPENAGDPACLVEFSDGVTVNGRWRPSDTGLVVHIPAHRTARGTRIDGKTWLLQPDAGQGRWRVRKKLTEAF